MFECEKRKQNMQFLSFYLLFFFFYFDKCCTDGNIYYNVFYFTSVFVVDESSFLKLLPSYPQSFACWFCPCLTAVDETL